MFVQFIFLKFSFKNLIILLVFGVPFKEIMKGCQNQKIIVPNIVTDCVQSILAKGLYTKGIFRDLPFEEEAEVLRSALDHEEAVSFDESSPLTVAWLLLRWLRELPEPLIPFKHYDKVIQAKGKIFKLIRRKNLFFTFYIKIHYIFSNFFFSLRS